MSKHNPIQPPKTQPPKPDRILDAAADLFAARPFHEVRLEDIADRAHVGKGTVYLHWSSKEEVYLAIIRRGFAQVLSRLDQELPSHAGNTWAELQAVVQAIVDFAFDHPGVYRIMRSGSLTPEDPALQATRRDLTTRIEQVLTSGVAQGTLNDPCPALTAQYILSFVRGALLYPPPNLTRASLTAHILHILRQGITARGPQ